MHQDNQAQKIEQLVTRNTPRKNDTRHTKNDLWGLGLDPRVVVETRENSLSFALGSSQFLKYLQGKFQNLTFTMMLLQNLLTKNVTPPQSKITLSHTYLSRNKLQKIALLLQKITNNLITPLQNPYYSNKNITMFFKEKEKNLLIPPNTKCYFTLRSQLQF